MTTNDTLFKHTLPIRWIGSLSIPNDIWKEIEALREKDDDLTITEAYAKILKEKYYS